VSLPLTRRQTLMWLDGRLYPDAPLHNTVATLDIAGPITPDRLASAWVQTVADRDALRLSIDAQEPVQTLASAPVELPRVDLPSPEAASAWIAERCVQPLRGERPWEAALLRLSPTRHIFYLCQHHIIADGQSIFLIFENLAARYQGQVPALAPGFAEYVAAEAEFHRSAAGQASQAYWAEKLAAPPPPVRLYGKARTERSLAQASAWTDVSAQTTERLRALASDPAFRSLTPAVSRLGIMATALAAFLYRASGQPELVIGTPVANRSGRFARTCGVFMEQIFLRLEVEPGETFTSLADKVRRELLDGLRHGRACVSTRDLGHTSLNMLPPPPTDFAGMPASFGLYPTVAYPGAQLPGEADLRDTLGLRLVDFGQNPLRVAWDLHTATFAPAVAERCRRHFVAVLDALARDPAALIEQVDLLDEQERQQVLAAARGPEPAGWAPDLVARFRARAAEQPDATAAIGPEGSLTYRELDGLTDRLAARLAELGVGPEARVAVALPRGLRELSALLATLKAGGGYVPVDLGHPIERVAVILEDAAPQVLVSVTGSPLVSALPAGAKLLALDELPLADDGAKPPEPATMRPVKSQLAYILFTSGSTGRPKGVEITRGAFANFLRAMEQVPGLGATDRILAITTTTFDIAGLELFLPLWVGGTVVIADRETAADARLLRGRLREQAITVLQATPAAWRLLLEAGFVSTPGLRMFCGGEALSPELAQRLLAGGGELWNLYGPTETTVWSTVERIEPASLPITIGRPIDHTQIYVVDGGGKIVPPLVVGEIAIGGRGLARGYRGRPELTAERFVPDPYAEPPARLYRTGDLGRLLDDGRFECLGRLDHQVKIRGFRIELGEIESVLRAVPSVREALAIAWPQAGADPVLCAYWTGEASRDLLFQAARAKLPVYMLPTAFLHVDAFPLNTNGKIDRKALPKPDAAALAVATGTGPRNDAEERIAAIWSEVLGVSPVGVDQDFFALGGTSLKAVEVRARIEKAFAKPLPLRALFENPTIENLVGHLGQDTSDEPIVVRLRRGLDELPPLHCLFGIELYQDLARALPADRTVVGIHVPVRYRPGREQVPGVAELARRYLLPIRELQPHGPYHLLGFCFGGIVAFEVARQLEASGERVATVTVLDSLLPRAHAVNWRGRLAEATTKLGASSGNLRAIGRSVAEYAKAELEPFLGRLATRLHPTAEMREVRVDGPDLETEVRKYENGMQPLRGGRLLVFQGLGDQWPKWVRIAPGLGWLGQAPLVSAHRVPSSHLALVRPPHSTTLARVLAPMLLRAERGTEDA